MAVGVAVWVGKGGTVKETVGVASVVQVARSVFVGGRVKVGVRVTVAVEGISVAVPDGKTTISGSGGVGNRVLQAVTRSMLPRAIKRQGIFMSPLMQQLYHFCRFQRKSNREQAAIFIGQAVVAILALFHKWKLREWRER